MHSLVKTHDFLFVAQYCSPVQVFRGKDLFHKGKTEFHGNWKGHHDGDFNSNNNFVLGSTGVYFIDQDKLITKMDLQPPFAESRVPGLPQEEDAQSLAFSNNSVIVLTKSGKIYNLTRNTHKILPENINEFCTVIPVRNVYAVSAILSSGLFIYLLIAPTLVKLSSSTCPALYPSFPTHLTTVDINNSVYVLSCTKYQVDLLGIGSDGVIVYIQSVEVLEGKCIYAIDNTVFVGGEHNSDPFLKTVKFKISF